VAPSGEVVSNMLPKGPRFENLAQVELNEFFTEIIKRPCKILGWAIPAENF
jgi:IS30 family transposase